MRVASYNLTHNVCWPLSPSRAGERQCSRTTLHHWQTSLQLQYIRTLPGAPLAAQLRAAIGLFTWKFTHQGAGCLFWKAAYLPNFPMFIKSLKCVYLSLLSLSLSLSLCPCTLKYENMIVKNNHILRRSEKIYKMSLFQKFLRKCLGFLNL